MYLAVYYTNWEFLMHLAESIEAGILMSTFDDAEDLVVNVSSTVDLLCVAYGTTSAPSVEWTSTTNGRIAVITNNSTNNQRVIINDCCVSCEQLASTVALPSFSVQHHSCIEMLERICMHEDEIIQCHVFDCYQGRHE